MNPVDCTCTNSSNVFIPFFVLALKHVHLCGELVQAGLKSPPPTQNHYFEVNPSYFSVDQFSEIYRWVAT